MMRKKSVVQKKTVRYKGVVVLLVYQLKISLNIEVILYGIVDSQSHVGSYFKNLFNFKIVHIGSSSVHLKELHFNPI